MDPIPGWDVSFKAFDPIIIGIIHLYNATIYSDWRLNEILMMILSNFKNLEIKQGDSWLTGT